MQITLKLVDFPLVKSIGLALKALHFFKHLELEKGDKQIANTSASSSG